MSEKKMRSIKRYQNRKLYDTIDSCYVTLEDIGELIKMGEEVKVVDNKTHEDLTAVTLAQIILEEQKRKTNVLPESIFTQIIRTGGGALRELLAKTIENGVRVVDEKIRPTVQGMQHLPSLHTEIERLKQKIDSLERTLEQKKKF